MQPIMIEVADATLINYFFFFMVSILLGETIHLWRITDKEKCFAQIRFYTCQLLFFLSVFALMLIFFKEDYIPNYDELLGDHPIWFIVYAYSIYLLIVNGGILIIWTLDCMFILLTRFGEQEIQNFFTKPTFDMFDEIFPSDLD